MKKQDESAQKGGIKDDTKRAGNEGNGLGMLGCLSCDGIAFFEDDWMVSRGD